MLMYYQTFWIANIVIVHTLVMQLSIRVVKYKSQ
jgi:hypothetical protein